MNDWCDFFTNKIEDCRIAKMRELSDAKASFKVDAPENRKYIFLKNIAVLCYANWEGFYNECVFEYIKFLKTTKKQIKDVQWSMLLGLLNPLFQSLQARNHSESAKREFIDNLAQKLVCDFNEFSEDVLNSKSNLNFEVLRDNFYVLGFDVTKFEKHRLKINMELVKWKNEVAHGDIPRLNNIDVDKHVNFTDTLILLLADEFISNIYYYSS